MKHNPYTVKTIMRIDKLIYTIKGRKPFWDERGWLIIPHKSGKSLGEARTHFPGWLFTLTCKVRHQYYVIRHKLRRAHHEAVE